MWFDQSLLGSSIVGLNLQDYEFLSIFGHELCVKDIGLVDKSTILSR